MTVTFVQHGTSIQLLNKVLSQPKAQLVAFDDQNLKIQLTFDEPLLVSAGTKLDRVFIKIHKDYFLFAVKQDGPRDEVEEELEEEFEEYKTLSEPLLRVIDPEEYK